jgi:hypothetical protein
MILSSPTVSALLASLSNPAHGWVVSSVQDSAPATVPFAGGTVCLSSDHLLMQMVAPVATSQTAFDIYIDGSNFHIASGGALNNAIMTMAVAWQTALAASALARASGP